MEHLNKKYLIIQMWQWLQQQYQQTTHIQQLEHNLHGHSLHVLVQGMVLMQIFNMLRHIMELLCYVASTT